MLLEQSLGKLTDYRLSLGIRRGHLIRALLKVILLVLIKRCLARLPQEDLALLGGTEARGMQPERVLPRCRVI